MNTLTFRIGNDILEKHPGYRWGLLVYDEIDNRGDAAALRPLLRQAEAEVRARNTGPIAEHPAVVSWRAAFKAFGAKPSEHRASIEALLRRVLKPDELPSILPLVDVGNIVSLRHELPVGVHPLRADMSTVALRKARDGDTFDPPDGGPQEVPPVGEVVLACESRVLTRRWVWRQAAGTQLERDTRRVFVNVDGLPPCTGAVVTAAMKDIAELVAAHCGAKPVFEAVLDASRPEVVLPGLPAR